MAESFGRIVAIIISVYLMIVAPVYLLRKQSECIGQMYSYDETEQFCNAVRNTGKISPDMYETLMQKLYGAGASYKLLMEHRTSDGEYYYSDEILAVLETGGTYFLSAGDYIRMVVTEKEKDGTDRYIAFCGGMIKDEDK